MPRSVQQLRNDLIQEPSAGVAKNVIDDMYDHVNEADERILREYRRGLVELERGINPGYTLSDITDGLQGMLEEYAQIGGKRKKLSTTFCRCIKSVRKTIKARKGSTKEQGAIAVCVKSVLKTRGKTLKKFRCGPKARLTTRRIPSK
jgi:hypothetical protein